MTVLERKNLRRAMYSREALKTEEEEEGRRKYTIKSISVEHSIPVLLAFVLFVFIVCLNWHCGKTP